MNNASPRTITYPGSFDPITMGHVGLVRRALAIFDRVIVAVADSTDKPTTFSLQERVDMVGETFADKPRVMVEAYRGLMSRYVRDSRADAVLRGLRAVSDFDSEFQLALMNHRQDPHVRTLFLMMDPQWLYVSSSGIKNLARLGGNITGMVPECVARRLRERFGVGDGASGRIMALG